jgi:hypothetical protein
MRGRTGVRSALAAIALVASIGVLEATARAASPPIAEVAAATPLSGGGGWLVWSSPAPGGWALMGYHGGKVQRLPVAVRRQPFDATVGSDRTGAPVVTFSSCAEVPEMATVGEQGGPGGAVVAPQTGRECHVHLLELDKGRVISLPIPTRHGVSDTSASMWRGTVTFARHDPAHGDVWQVLSWSPRRARRLTTLPHGRIPSCPEQPHGCRHRAQGMVGALSSDGTIVTFLWKLPFGEEGLVGEGAWEIRVDRADGSGSTLADGGFGHEACTAPTSGPHELEYIRPEPPIAAGPSALFPELYAFSCFKGFASVLGSHGATAGHASVGKLETVALAVARDEGRLYGLVPPPGVAPLGDSPGCTTTAPCKIEQVQTPSLRRQGSAPFVPFQ